MKFRIMGTVAIAAVAAVLGVTASQPAAAKTLVFCSEGSPGGFNLSLHSAGTNFDA